MTFTMKQERKGDMLTTLEYEPFTGIYKVSLMGCHGCEVYRTEKQNRTTNRANALATFRRYAKQM